MKLEYFLQDDSSYLAVEPETDEDGYRLVIEVEKHQDGAIIHWEGHSSRRPVFSFVHLSRIPANDVPKGVRREARYKYSQN